MSFPKINTNKTHRWKRLSQLLISPPKILKKTHKNLRKEYATNNNPVINSIVKMGMIFNNINSKDSKREKISDMFRLELEEAFEDEITKISAILDRDLSSWFKIKKADQLFTKKVDIQIGANSL
jgi:hypothetical protein